MLFRSRPHGSQTVQAFTQWLYNALPADARATAHFDDVGNLHVDNRSGPDHRTLFVAHVDTVHHTEGFNKFIVKDGAITAALPGECLGADDGAGVAMLMHMLWHDVSGYYIFTQGEECGGIGARHLVQEHADVLMEFDRAIAFDRKGLGDVITHQGWSRCCSDEFAQSLAHALTTDTMWMLPDDTGVYTDTAEFVDLIPECTNISVGYSGAHTGTESLDMTHFCALAMQVLTVQWDALPTARDPSVIEEFAWEKDWTSQWTQGHNWGTMPVTSTWTPTAEEMELCDALDDARIGLCQPLIELIANAVHPEDPAIVKRCVSKRALNDALLDYADQMVDEGYSTHEILYELYDEVVLH